MTIQFTSGCSCKLPDYLIDKGHLGNWYVQLFWCEQCSEVLKIIVYHQYEIDYPEEAEPLPTDCDRSPNRLGGQE